MSVLGPIAFVGGGVMGEAILKALLEKGLTSPDQVAIAEPVAARRKTLEAAYAVRTTAGAPEAVPGAGTVVLSIKPQNLPEVMAALKPALRADQLVLSIIAGATLGTLTQGLGHEAVVRVMPNTPAQIGEGMSVWIATEAVNEPSRVRAATLLAALGQELQVEQEHYLDMATALSGSGPAYVFLFIEALIDAGVHIGMPRDMAERLSLQTVLGSARFAQAAGQHPAVLRNMVTSPGGTTTEGVLRLEEGAIRALVTRAVEAAYQKSQALGRKEPSH